MLFGRSTWSELPLSTTKQTQPNGEEFDFGFLIDEAFQVDGDIETQLGWIFFIDEARSFDLLMDTTSNYSLATTTSYGIELEIDENNTWELS